MAILLITLINLSRRLYNQRKASKGKFVLPKVSFALYGSLNASKGHI
nr:MAG TPA: hypothetical protein [Caudoviricetes sp.]